MASTWILANAIVMDSFRPRETVVSRHTMFAKEKTTRNSSDEIAKRDLMIA